MFYGGINHSFYSYILKIFVGKNELFSVYFLHLHYCLVVNILLCCKIFARRYSTRMIGV